MAAATHLHGATPEEEEKKTIQLIASLIPVWIANSGIKCRRVWGVFAPESASFSPFGHGDEKRFIARVKSTARSAPAGHRVTVMWRASTVERCLDIAFATEKDQTEPVVE